MQLYITQLIEDITVASRSENIIKPVVQEEEETFEDYIEEVERFISGEGYEYLRSILGLDEIQFPPVDRLTDEQMESVVLAFKNCLASWNVCLDLPQNLPISIQYTSYIRTLSQNIDVVNYGTVHLEACTYCSDVCPLGNYCDCKEFEDEFSDDINFKPLNDGELSF
ncbi:MAG: hypothetical protein U0V72_10520 [Cytophagales bacterium]